MDNNPPYDEGVLKVLIIGVAITYAVVRATVSIFMGVINGLSKMFIMSPKAVGLRASNDENGLKTVTIRMDMESMASFLCVRVRIVENRLKSYTNVIRGRGNVEV